MGLSGKQWALLLVGGIIAGLMLTALVPHPGISLYSTTLRAQHFGPRPGSTVSILPWILVVGGFILGVVFRNNSSFLTFAGSAITAGVTLLTTSH